MRKMKMTIGEHVAHRIRDLRIHYNSGEGISQDALSRELDVAANTISRWETGIYRPSIDDLEKLARFFVVPITSFFPPEGIESDDNDLLTLLRAAKHLNPDDLDELIKYAEFRRARRIYKGRSRPKAGRTSRKK
jgi:transcriptional regulator with XRE-family HTH domain